MKGWLGLMGGVFATKFFSGIHFAESAEATIVKKTEAMLRVPNGTNIASITAKAIGSGKIGWDGTEKLVVRIGSCRMGYGLVNGFHYRVDGTLPLIGATIYQPLPGGHLIQWFAVEGSIEKLVVAFTFFVYS